jgi:predicted RecA/RadA family phage recombinase
MPEAVFVRDSDQIRYTAAGAVGAGEIRQLADGRASFYDSNTAASLDDKVVGTATGQVTVAKTNGVVILDGGRCYWDHSANSVTYKPANDRDFFVGTAVGDWASGDTLITVNLNVEPRYLLDINRDPTETVFVGTRALGVMDLQARGGAYKFNISATNEAQKIDILTQDGFSKDANAIIELIFNVRDDGAGTVVDVSLGAANATNATDADAITESLFIHLNANDVNIYAESDDGTTEVAATDTTIDYTAGTPVEVWFDMRNPADVQIYVNAALVLGSTVFNVNAAVGPFKLLAHVEKTAATDAYEFDINRLCARIAEQ